MAKVSRTLWSVINTPMPRSFKVRMISLISPTEIGSTPAKGSSNSINLGSAAKARAISARRRSPPDTLIPNESLICVILKSASNSAKRC